MKVLLCVHFLLHQVIIIRLKNIPGYLFLLRFDCRMANEIKESKRDSREVIQRSSLDDRIVLLYR